MNKKYLIKFTSPLERLKIVDLLKTKYNDFKLSEKKLISDGKAVISFDLSSHTMDIIPQSLKASKLAVSFERFIENIHIDKASSTRLSH